VPSQLVVFFRDKVIAVSGYIYTVWLFDYDAMWMISGSDGMQ